MSMSLFLSSTILAEVIPVSTQKTKWWKRSPSFHSYPTPFSNVSISRQSVALPIQKRISDGLRLTEHYQPLKPAQESQDHQSPGCSSSLLPEALLAAFWTLPALTCYSPASSLLPCLCLNTLSLSWPPTSFLFRFQPLSCISWLSDLIYFIFPHHSLTILCSFSRNNL